MTARDGQTQTAALPRATFTPRTGAWPTPAGVAELAHPRAMLVLRGLTMRLTSKEGDG